jgi:hypothetical protein
MQDQFLFEGVKGSVQVQVITIYTATTPAELADGLLGLI